VPGQLPATGYDDSTLARLAHVDLTSVSQAAREQACRAVALAAGRLEGGRIARGRCCPAAGGPRQHRPASRG
jgi:DNA-binding LacI/PurR family transcriptional regulator